MRSHKNWTKIALAAFLLSIVVWRGGEALSWISVAHADPGVGNDPLNSAVADISVWVSYLITAMNTATWFLFRLLELLLDPAFIFNLQNGQSSLMDLIQEVWIISRDTVNVIFAFILIFGAVWMIATANREHVKHMAPRFVLYLILVNFTWFGARVILDVANVFTATVYAIPETVGQTDCQVPDENGQDQPCRVVTGVAYFEETDNLNTGDDAGHDGDGGKWECSIPHIVCYSWVPFDDAGSSQPLVKLLSGLVVSYGRLGTLARPAAVMNGPNGNTLNYLVKMAVVLLIHVALFFPLVAMCIAFLIRIPILWITMAFMPFVVLSYVIPSQVAEFDPKKHILHNFIISAFLPALVGLPLSIGFILISAGSGMAPANGTIPDDLQQMFPLFAGIPNVYQAIWMMIALGILWTGVFNILKRQTIGSSIISSIEGAGKSIGSFALKAPLAAPVLPTVNGVTPAGQEGTSVLQLLKKPGQMMRDMSVTGRLSSNADKVKQIKNTVNNLNDTQRTEIKVMVQDFENANDTNRRAKLDDLRRKMQQLNPQFSGSDEEMLKGLGQSLHYTDEKTDALLQKLHQAPPRGAGPAAP